MSGGDEWSFLKFEAASVNMLYSDALVHWGGRASGALAPVELEDLVVRLDGLLRDRAARGPEAGEAM